MNWYRVELNNDGQVTGCTMITRDRVCGRLIFFVRADTEEAAVQKLLERREKRLTRLRLYQRDKKAARRAEGACVGCGLVLTEGVTCPVCRERDSKRKARYRDFGPQKPKAISLDQQLASEASDVEQHRRSNNKSYATKAIKQREQLLQELIELFDSLQPEAFRAAMVQQLRDSRSARGLIHMFEPAVEVPVGATVSPAALAVQAIRSARARAEQEPTAAE